MYAPIDDCSQQNAVEAQSSESQGPGNALVGRARYRRPLLAATETITMAC